MKQEKTVETYFRDVHCHSCGATVEEMLWEDDLWRATCKCGARWFTDSSRRAILEQMGNKTMLRLSDESSLCRAVGDSLVERCRSSPIIAPEGNGNGSPKPIAILITKVGKYHIRNANVVMAMDTETKEEFIIWGKQIAEQLIAEGEGHGERIVIVLCTGKEQLRWLNTVTHLLKAT